MQETEQNVQSQPQPYQDRKSLYLPTNRSIVKFIIFNLLTFGIYGLVFYSHISEEINMIASRYDGKWTMQYCLMILASPFTLGILGLVWFNNISARIGNELQRRGVNYQFGAGSFWGWNFLGILLDILAYAIPFILDSDNIFIIVLSGIISICGIICIFMYNHKLAKAMNILCDLYNKAGI